MYEAFWQGVGIAIGLMGCIFIGFVGGFAIRRLLDRSNDGN